MVVVVVREKPEAVGELSCPFRLLSPCGYLVAIIGGRCQWSDGLTVIASVFRTCPVDSSSNLGMDIFFFILI